MTSEITVADFGLTFHHIALASGDAEASLAFLRGLGYVVGASVRDDQQGVDLVLCTHDSMPDLEVVSSSGDAGPVDGIVAAVGDTLYHVCYSTIDLASTLEAFRRAGHRVICVSPPKPAILFGGRQVSFYRIKGFGLVELLEP